MPRVPRLLSGPNVKSSELSPPEALLLSHVDALLNEHDLALVTGMPPAEVSALLDRLSQRGAVELVDLVEDAAYGGPKIPAPAGSTPGGAAPMAPHLDFGASAAPYDPAELNEQVELEPEKKRRVLDIFYRLDELTYYELLGVPSDADKKAVKSAYYAVAPDFHPDKHFRKQLGSYKPKIEAIFGRITLAHDVLTTQKRRVEYDEYLEQTHRNRTTSAMLDQSKHDVEAILAAVEQAAAQAVQQSAGQVRAGSSPARALSPEEVMRQRKETLARRLSGGRRPVPAGPPAKPAEMDPAVAERAAEALRVRHEAALAEAKNAQVVRYTAAGRAALLKQDYAEAANSYRIAASLVPEDAAVQATCAAALREVAVALADGYWKQALYEEGQERWAEAALSYSKVCAGKSDNAAAHERVAFTTVKSHGNARRAVEFARKAIELDPKKPEFRVTLARSYAAAGLDQSAQHELDRALEMAPKDQKVIGLVTAARASLGAKDARDKEKVAAAGAAGAAAAAGTEAAPPPKARGLTGFLNAVRAAIAPKEGK